MFPQTIKGFDVLSVLSCHVETVVLLSNTDAKAAHPLDISYMTQEGLNAELEKGYADIRAGRVRPVEDVLADIRKDYDI